MEERLELGVMRALPKEIKYIYRDEVGDLWASTIAPQRVEAEDGDMMYLPTQDAEALQALTIFNHLFPEVAPFVVMQVNFEDLGDVEVDYEEEDNDA